MPDDIPLKLEQDTPTDEYGRTPQPELYPTDPVQADHAWYNPDNKNQNKNLISKNMSLSFLEHRDITYIDMTIDLVNITDTLILNFQKKLGIKDPNDERLKPLLEARNDIAIELDAMLTAKRAIQGRTAILSRTAHHDISQKYTQEMLTHKDPGRIKKLRNAVGV